MNTQRVPVAVLLTILLVAAAPLSAWAAPFQESDTTRVTEDHYRFYTGEGAPMDWARVTAAMSTADVVLIGETHDDPVAHHLEARLLDAALQSGREVAASMEMFTRDVQMILDEYLSGLISEQQFLAASEPWGNYATDYRPFVERAREAGRPVIAANAPRRYVNRVSRNGAESLNDLSESARSFLAPLPYQQASAAYKAEWDALMREAMGNMPEPDSAGTPGGGMHAMMGSALQAQSLWDATMAWSVVEYLTRHPGEQVVHIVGSFHVKNGTGIPEHISRYRPGTEMLIVVVEPAAEVDHFDHASHHGLGDVVVLADDALPRTKR